MAVADAAVWGARGDGLRLWAVDSDRNQPRLSQQLSYLSREKEISDIVLKDEVVIWTPVIKV